MTVVAVTVPHSRWLTIQMKRRAVLKAGAALAALAAAPACAVPPRQPERVGIGIIGTGARGQGIAKNLTGFDGVDLVACCDVLPFRLQEGLEAAGPGVDGHEDYRRVLDDPRVDAVVIATPFHFHATPMIDALDAGKHVYCEKTAVKGHDQIDAVRAVAEDTDRIIQVGYQFRHSRLYEHVVERIHAGEIGAVSRIECQWNRNTNWRRPAPDPKYERAVNWRMYRDYSGGLAAELSSHQLDFCNWLLGAEPRQIMGSGGIDYWKDGRETRDNIYLLVTYENGVEASFSCLTTNAHNGYLIKIFGTEGTIIMKRDSAWLAWQDRGDKEYGEVDAVSGATILIDNAPAAKIDFEHTAATRQALMDFVDSVRTGAKPRSTLEAGLLGSLMVQKALDAMDQGSVERLA